MSKLLDDVLANIPSRQRPTFASSLPPDLLAEVTNVKAEFLAGRIRATKTGLGKALAATLNARGIDCHPVTVTRWLDAR